MSILSAASTTTPSTARETVRIAEDARGALLPVALEMVARTYREGDDLIVALASGVELAIVGFFARLEANGDFALLVGDGEGGEVAVLILGPNGETEATESIALGRLEEMFGGQNGIHAVHLPGSENAAIFGVDFEWNPATQLAAVSAVAVGVIVLTEGDGGDDGGGNPFGNPSDVTIRRELDFDFDGDGTNDATLTDTDNDGNADLLVLRNDVNRMEGALATTARGVETIRLAGSEGSRLYISDEQLAALGGGEAGYRINIDGGSDDFVWLYGGIYDTGRAIFAGTGLRFEYQGEFGRILVAQGLEVLVTPTPLSEDDDTGVLDSPEDMTLHALRGAGIRSVTEDNIENVRTVLSAYTDAERKAMTVEQVQAYVNTVNLFVDSEAGETISTVITGSLTLVIERPDESDELALHRVVQIVQDSATFLPVSASTTEAIGNIVPRGPGREPDTHSFPQWQAGSGLTLIAAQYIDPSNPNLDAALRILLPSKTETFEYDHFGRLVKRTTDDGGRTETTTVTVEVNSNGFISTTTEEVDLTFADGDIDQAVRYDVGRSTNPSEIASDRLRTSVETYGTFETIADADGDGTGDRRQVIMVDDPSNGDGVDREDTIVYSGTTDTDRIISISYDLAEDGLGTDDSDSSPDGSAQYIYFSGGTNDGRLSMIEVNYDGDSTTDGTADETALLDRMTEYTYHANGSVETERESISNEDDGTFDEIVTRYYDGAGDKYDYVVVQEGENVRLEYQTGSRFSHVVDGSLDGLVGVKTISLAGDGGATALTLNELDLEHLSDVDDDGTVDEDFVLTVNGDSDDTLTGTGIWRRDSEQDRGDYKAYQGASGLVLVSREVLVANIVSETDSNDDGTAELFEHDHDGDGTIDRTVYDGVGTNGTADGTPERETFDTDDNGTVNYTLYHAGETGTADRFEYDRDENGTIDLKAYDSDEDGHPELWEFDTDEDGTTEATGYDSDDDGIVNYYEIDVNQDGTMDGYVLDDDDNGTLDFTHFDSDLNGVFEYAVRAPNDVGQDINEITSRTIDRPSETIHYDRRGRISTNEVDSNRDGDVDEYQTYIYHSFDPDGRVVADAADSFEDGAVDGSPDDIRYYFHGAYIPTSPDGRVRVVKADSPQSEGRLPTGIAVDFDGDGTVDAEGVPTASVETLTETVDGTDQQVLNQPSLLTVFFRPDDTVRDPQNPYWAETMVHDYAGYPLLATVIAGDSIYMHGQIAIINMEYSYGTSEGQQDGDLYVSRIQYDVTHGTAENAQPDREWGEAFSYTFTAGPDGITQIVNTIKKDVYSTNPDGTEDPDRTELYHYDEDGMIESVDIDSAGTSGSGTADGTYDSTETYFYGASAFHDKYHDAGKRHVYKTMDDDRDGTADSLDFANGVTYTFAPDADEVDALVGITKINMSGTANDPAYPAVLINGMATLAISDEVLTELADRDGNGVADTGYILAIDSDGTNDIVQLGSGIVAIADGAAGSTDSDNRKGYQGTDGIIYIDPDITVETT